MTSVISPVQVPGLPVAGHFYAGAAKGDQVAIFTGSVWYILSSDLSHVQQTVRWTPQSGLPVVGDFDGDGMSDLATWRNGMLTISYASSGFSTVLQQPIPLNFPGVGTRPVAVDIDGDGIDDLGFWVPDNGVPSTTEARPTGISSSRTGSAWPRIQPSMSFTISSAARWDYR